MSLAIQSLLSSGRITITKTEIDKSERTKGRIAIEDFVEKGEMKI